jgi:hypothetical protein
VAVDDASETMVQAALSLMTLPFVHANIDASKFHGAAPTVGSSRRSL